MAVFETTSTTRKAAVTGLAAVGFIALIILGMGLAVYSARFVPAAVDTLGTAAVYLGSVFTPSSSPGLAVVPTASSTIPFPDAASTTPVATTTLPTTTPTKPSRPVATTPGTPSSGTYPMGGGTTPSAPYGLPDLTVSITAVGYLTSASAESFVASPSVPSGSRPAVRFTVRNVGTGVAGPWIFFATIPAMNSYVYQSQAQQGLNPGDTIEFTLGFDQANKGVDQTVSITVNPNRAVTESNVSNNDSSAKLTIVGS